MASWPAAARRRFGWLAAAGGRPEIPTVKPYAWLAFLLLARLALGLAYSIAIPAGEAPDEADHLAYAAYIAREHRLPQGAEMTQAKHPPLYHALAAAVGGRAGMDTSFLRANPDVGFTADAAPNFFVHTTLEDWPWRDGPLAMHLARLVSVLAGVGLVAAVYALGVAVWPRRPDLALAAAAFVAFLPESLFIAAAMNNDTLAALLGTLALWLALRSRRPWHAAVAGIVMGLGLWAKVSVAALWPAVCLALAVRGWDEGRITDGGRPPAAGPRPTWWQWRTWRLAFIAGGVALAVAAPWFLRNRQLYGDWMGWPLVLATIDRRTGPFGPAELWWLLRGLFVSFWGKFGGAGHMALPWPFYAFWGVIVGASILGWLKRIANRQIGTSANTFYVSRLTFDVALILIAAPLLLFLWLIAYSRAALGTDQGRLLFPAIGPLALLLVGGLAGGGGQSSVVSGQRSVVSGRWAAVGLAGWTAVMAAVAVGALVFGLWLPYAPPPAVPAAEAMAGRPVEKTFGGQIELVSYRWEPAAGPDGDRRLVIYWRAVRPIAADLRTSLRLVGAAGELLWEWKRSPGAGRFSTDRWPVGRLVADVYRVPAGPLAAATRVEIGVRPFPEGAWLMPDGAGQTPWAILERPTP